MRKIHINDKEWGYRIGRENVVIQEPNSNKKTVIHMHKIIGISVHEFYDSMYEGRNVLYPIQPSHIKAYIEKNMISCN